MPKIKSNGINLYYEVHGQGQPLFLIAGLACDCLLWTPLLPELSRHFQVTIFDNRGVGRSDTPATDYTIEQMSNDAYALMTALGIKKAHVLGHSLGGAIAQQLAYKHPEIIEHLILSNTSSKFNKLTCIVQSNILALRKTNVPIPLIIDAVIPWLYSNSFVENPKLLDGIRQLLLNNPYPQTNEGFQGQIHALETFDSRRWLAKIKNSTLIIAGGEDVLCLNDGKILKEHLKNAPYVVIPGVGHIPFVEDPQQFVQHVFNFLAAAVA